MESGKVSPAVTILSNTSERSEGLHSYRIWKRVCQMFQLNIMSIFQASFSLGTLVGLQIVAKDLINFLDLSAQPLKFPQLFLQISVLARESFFVPKVATILQTFPNLH